MTDDRPFCGYTSTYCDKAREGELCCYAHEKAGCGYTGCHFGAAYEDAVCSDGFLWDLDSCEVPGGPLYAGGDIPCPECNKSAWDRMIKEEADEAAAVAADDA